MGHFTVAKNYKKEVFLKIVKEILLIDAYAWG
jgi:hypothetical protein